MNPTPFDRDLTGRKVKLRDGTVVTLTDRITIPSDTRWVAYGTDVRFRLAFDCIDDGDPYRSDIVELLDLDLEVEYTEDFDTWNDDEIVPIVGQRVLAYSYVTRELIEGVVASIETPIITHGRPRFRIKNDPRPFYFWRPASPPHHHQETTMTNDLTFSELIRSHGHNQTSIAEAAGLARLTISRIATGRRKATGRVIRKVANALGCDPLTVYRSLI